MRKSQKEIKEQLRLFRSDLRALKRWLGEKKGRYIRVRDRQYVMIDIPDVSGISIMGAIWLCDPSKRHNTPAKMAVAKIQERLGQDLGYSRDFEHAVEYACNSFVRGYYENLRGTRREIARLLAKTFGLVPARQ